ncbi:MAG: 2Fe-2S iron-sulfur cluster-binding protein [Acidobacteriota bacterium]
MPTLRIDGKEVTVENGTTILKAAESIGIIIPHFCYHPELSIAGNCRMCVVEVERMPKLQTACSTEVSDGMVVHTTTDRVVNARRAIMEFLLINHPLDCPICDQAGECRLQDYSVRYGMASSRFAEEKVKSVKREIFGPHVIYDGERCIKCTRCIRFCYEITKTGELDMFFRGDHSTVGIFPERDLKNDYSGNVVDLCPVGALTLREFRFKSRVWDLKKVNTICPACGRGCNIIAWVKDNRIFRLTPRFNPHVNRSWMCDHGRLSHEFLYRSERLVSPEIMNAERRRLNWKEAFDCVTDALKSILQNHGSGSIHLVVFPFITNEDAFLILKVLKDVFPKSTVSIPIIEIGEDDSLLIRKDRTPNRRGVEEIFREVSSRIISVDDAAKRVKEGMIKSLVVLGEGLTGANDCNILADTPISPLEFSLFIGSFKPWNANDFSAMLPASTWAELDGTFTNFEGFVQRIFPSVLSSCESRPLWKIVQELGSRIGTRCAFRSASSVFEKLAEEHQSYRELRYFSLTDESRIKK